MKPGGRKIEGRKIQSCCSPASPRGAPSRAAFPQDSVMHAMLLTPPITPADQFAGAGPTVPPGTYSAATKVCFTSSQPRLTLAAQRTM